MDLELDRSITYVLIVHTLEKRLFQLRGHLSSCSQSTSYDQGVWVELSMEYLIHAQSTHQSLFETINKQCVLNHLKYILHLTEKY